MLDFPGHGYYARSMIETPPFDPAYAGADLPIDADTAWSISTPDYFRDVPERFVADELPDPLADLAGPARDRELDDWQDYCDSQQQAAEIEVERRNERWFEDRGWSDFDPYN